MLDITHLKQLTEEAIQRGEAEAEKLRLSLLEKKEREEREQERKAQSIIEQIPSRAEKEAALGRNYAIIMSVKTSDYKAGVTLYGEQVKPAHLIGACKLVFAYCEKMGLAPTLEYWWSGDGMNSGHNIVVHW